MKTLLLISLIALQGCGVVIPYRHSEAKFDKLEIGQTKTEVHTIANRPSVIRGAKLTEDGKTIQMDEYRLYSRNVWWAGILWGIPTATISWWLPKGDWKPYWVQYTDGKVTRWGAAGDWQADRTINQTYGAMNK